MTGNELDETDGIRDYAVQIKVRNNRILHYMRAAGIANVGQLARAIGVNPSTLGILVNLQSSGQTKNDRWRALVQRLATFFRCLPEDLIPPQHVKAPLKRNAFEVEMSSEQVAEIIAGESPVRLPDAGLRERQAQFELLDVLSARLTPREERVIKRRFGFDGEMQTLAEISKELGVSATRVGGIERTALLKLRHKALKKTLRPLLEDLSK